MKNPLPYLVAFLTRRDRQIVRAGVDFDWSGKSWTHNAFRALELAFGRRAGARCEVVGGIDMNGRVFYEFHTVEALVAHVEGWVRGLVPKLLPDAVFVPAFAPAGVGAPGGFPFLLAIAYDAGNSTLFGASPRSFSLTTTGSNRLMVFNSSSLNDNANRATYNSVTSTFINKTTYPGVGRTGTSADYLIAPATGSNTASFSASSNLMGLAANYTGMKQSGQPDASAVTTDTSTTITATVTVGVTGCWLLGLSSDSSGSSYANGTGVKRVTSSDGAAIFDSNANVSTGSQSTNITVASAGWACVGVSFIEEPAAATVTPDLRTYFY